MLLSSSQRRLWILPTLAVCLGCSAPKWLVEENVSPEPKVKYDATWWSDRSEANVRDEIFQRRKELIEQRTREMEAMAQQPQQPPPAPPIHDQPPESRPPENHLISRIPPIGTEPALGRKMELVPFDEPSYSEAEQERNKFRATSAGRVQLVRHLEPIQSTEDPRWADEAEAAPLKIGADNRISAAVKLRAIIEDGQGDSIAQLELSGRRSVYVRQGDVIDVESAGVVVQALIKRIARDTVYLQTSDNPDTMVAVR